MFTGIVTDIGEIVLAEERATGRRFRIGTDYDVADVAIGASIACSGCCLTVVDKGPLEGRSKPYFFDVDVSPESLDKTTASAWREGTRLNLERSLKLGDELGGHMVSGHVDATADVVSRADEGDMARFTFGVPAEFARFVAPKGSVALDGTSLTVNGAEGNRFDVMLIPHTLEVTTWGTIAAGDRVNFEVDLMARYVARLNQ